LLAVNLIVLGRVSYELRFSEIMICYPLDTDVMRVSYYEPNSLGNPHCTRVKQVVWSFEKIVLTT